jgi:hypothetical protein
MNLLEAINYLRSKKGTNRCKIVATVTYNGDVNWLTYVLEKSLRTPFYAVRDSSINTTYEITDESALAPDAIEGAE